MEQGVDHVDAVVPSNKGFEPAGVSRMFRATMCFMVSRKP